MAAEYSNNTLQTVLPQQNVLFTESPVPCNRGFITHRSGSGVFTLQSIYSPYSSAMRCNCGCSNCNNKTTEFLVTFGANVAVSEGGTVGPVSLAIAINGEVLPDSTMTVTPAAESEFFSISRTIHVPVPSVCGCEEIAVKNISDTSVDVQNANIVFQIPQLNVTR